MKKTFKTILLILVFLIGAGTYTLNAQNPPAHAKAHGLKKKYRYYPEANVYFDPIARLYTYLNGGRWITRSSLPNTIRLVGAFNDFDFEGDDPWRENSKHKERYKPKKNFTKGNAKKIEKAFDSNDRNSNKKHGKKHK